MAVNQSHSTAIIEETVGIEVQAWPELRPEAYFGLSGDIVKAIEPHTEADPVALLIQLLVAFGNVVGREPHFVAEAALHPPNLFTALVGATSKGRKGSSWSHVKRLFSKIDKTWSEECVKSGLSSGEGLIWNVRDPIEKGDKVTEEGIEDKRLLVLESEFASPLKIMDRDGNTLSPTVRQAWDTGDLRIMTKNSPAEATEAHISIIGHITKDEFRRCLQTTDVANGFANRFLLACVRRSKCLPDGGNIEAVDLSFEITRLKMAVDHARKVGEMRRDRVANELWHEVYPKLSEGKPGLLGAVTSRAEAQVMRLACIYALMDLSDVIEKEHLRAALALWKFCENSARYVFGDSLGDPLADELLAALRGATGGMTRTDIRDLFKRNLNKVQIGRVLESLTDLGLVRCERKETGGRPSEIWIATAR